MESNQWVCERCGKVGGFILRGSGWIICAGCGQWHIVSASGSVQKVGKAEPAVLSFLRAPGASEV